MVTIFCSLLAELNCVLCALKESCLLSFVGVLCAVCFELLDEKITAMNWDFEGLKNSTELLLY